MFDFRLQYTQLVEALPVHGFLLLDGAAVRSLLGRDLGRLLTFLAAALGVRQTREGPVVLLSWVRIGISIQKRYMMRKRLNI